MDGWAPALGGWEMGADLGPGAAKHRCGGGGTEQRGSSRDSELGVVMGNWVGPGATRLAEKRIGWSGR